MSCHCERSEAICRNHCKCKAFDYKYIVTTISSMRFEWDPWKGASNQRKHGVSFDEAKTVFTDECARLIADPDHSTEEDRFILLGTSIHFRLLVVCHCIREGESIRIISARKANSREKMAYERYRHA